MNRRASRRRDQRGSVLMLMPAAILVLVILGSIAVDSSLAFLGQRALNDYTTAAANDAAASAVDPISFYEQDRISIRPDEAQDIARTLEAQIGAGVHDVRVSVVVDGDHVTVSATGLVDGLFARGLPGARRSWRVRSTSTATAHRLANP